MSLMYYLFIKQGIFPHLYYDLPAGEKIIVRAFMDRYFEEAHR